MAPHSRHFDREPIFDAFFEAMPDGAPGRP
jgi:hypothetical protein